jgi:hypothetical protein
VVAPAGGAGSVSAERWVVIESVTFAKPLSGERRRVYEYAALEEAAFPRTFVHETAYVSPICARAGPVRTGEAAGHGYAVVWAYAPGAPETAARSDARARRRVKRGEKPIVL